MIVYDDNRPEMDSSRIIPSYDHPKVQYNNIPTVPNCEKASVERIVQQLAYQFEEVFEATESDWLVPTDEQKLVLDNVRNPTILLEVALKVLGEREFRLRGDVTISPSLHPVCSLITTYVDFKKEAVQEWVLNALRSSFSNGTDTGLSAFERSILYASMHGLTKEDIHSPDYLHSLKTFYKLERSDDARMNLGILLRNLADRGLTAYVTDIMRALAGRK